MIQVLEGFQRGTLDGQAPSVTVEELDEALHVASIWLGRTTNALGNQTFEVIRERQLRVRAEQIAREQRHAPRPALPSGIGDADRHVESGGHETLTGVAGFEKTTVTANFVDHDALFASKDVQPRAEGTQGRESHCSHEVL